MTTQPNQGETKPDHNCPYCHGEGATGGIDMRPCRCLLRTELPASEPINPSLSYVHARLIGVENRVAQALQAIDLNGPALALENLKIAHREISRSIQQLALLSTPTGKESEPCETHHAQTVKGSAGDAPIPTALFTGEQPVSSNAAQGQSDPSLDAAAIEAEIIRGVMAVQMDNCSAMVADPNGPNPSCKNMLGTYICERCGNNVRDMEGACPAVPREKRWRFKESTPSPVSAPAEQAEGTPRTDADKFNVWIDDSSDRRDDGHWETHTHAETTSALERENAQLRATVEKYATSARVISLHLKDLCDEALPYDEMIADASRKAGAQLQELRADLARVSADAARLDWMTANPRLWYFSAKGTKAGMPIREAIDAASQPPAGESSATEGEVGI